MTPTNPFLSQREAVCPSWLLAMAQKAPTPRVAIARAGAPLPMEAARDATEANIMEPVFTGERNLIEAEAEKLGWDISQFEIIEATGEQDSGKAAAMACGEGRADVMMKGQLHSDAFMRAALARDAGLRTGNRLVHIFHISHPDGGPSITISDAAVNVDPNIDTRKDATREVVKLLQMLGNDRPKVAFLSATESVLPAVPSSVEAKELADWAKSEILTADFSGPLALDLILSPKAVATKKLTSDPVAGQADAIIVPDIVSGNSLFKSLVYLAGGCAAGIVMGAKVPVLLTSRADPPAARMASCCLAAIVNAAK
ncbi:phosphate acyltransferase [Litoreibacter janthinus]|uniref:Phosphate acetyltransferase n=1 Tax=Litoreibacter janthinus TaxID=670154 RepID=A0A1I6G718_9RHOB|nr:phosphate acyltransferase [Litoreibacter janthinus]SFR37837.1 phosphate acetyltransferase [Litoreibacter janthinus]